MNTVELLETIVKSLVYFPGEVEVTRTTDDLGVLLTVKLNPTEVGLVVGREGVVAKAIRVILKSVGRKNKEMINLRILDPRKV